MDFRSLARKPFQGCVNVLCGCLVAIFALCGPNANAADQSAFGDGFADNPIERNLTRPPNDNFSSRTTLSTTGCTTGTRVNATREAYEPTHCARGGRSVWWSWVAPGEGCGIVDITGSDTNTLLAVYTGSRIDSLALVACNTQPDGSLAQLVRFQTTPGIEYQIVADGFVPATKDISICVNGLPRPAAPTGPIPYDGQTKDTSLSGLSWTASPGAADYLVEIDGVTVGGTPEPHCTTVSLTGGLHHWRVAARLSCSQTWSPLWSYCILDPASVPQPPNGSKMCAGEPVALSWTDAAGGAASYGVVLDGATVAVTTATTFVLPSPPAAGPHRWKIVSQSLCGTDTAVSPEWTFTVNSPPAIPANPIPADGAFVQPNLTELRWSGSTTDGYFRVFLDGGYFGDTTANRWLSPPVALGVHTWQIVAVDACGETSGPLWSYCVNQTPSNPWPRDNDLICGAPPTSLSWSGSADAIFEVRFDGVIVDVTQTPTYVFPSPPSPGRHTWQIVSWSDCDSVESPVWNFKASSVPPFPASPNPTDYQSVPPTISQLSWSGSVQSEQYRVYIDGGYRGTTTDTRWLDPAVSVGLHTWEIVAVGSCGETTGPLWHYCINDVPSNPWPPDQGTVCGMPPEFVSWSGTAGAVFEVMVDGVIVEVTQDLSYTFPKQLAYGQHTWMIVSWSDCGSVSSPVWRFNASKPSGAPSVPVPTDGAMADSSLNKLQWTAPASFSPLSYTVYIDGARAGETTSTLWNLPPVTGGSHKWQVAAVNACGTTTGPLWTYCVCDRPIYPVPPADTIICNTPVTRLQWIGVSGLVNFVYLDGALVTTTTQSYVDLPSPVSSGRHSWYVSATTPCGVKDSKRWSFTVSSTPVTPSSPSPVPGAIVPSAPIDFSWSGGPADAVYSVYIDGALAAETTALTWRLATPPSCAQHTWRIKSRTACGSVDGTTWTFCVANAPSGPVPADGATVSLLTKLDWADACGALSYNVYIDGAFVASTPISELASLPVLSDGSHSWQVRAVGACGEVIGPLWTFTLSSTPSYSWITDGKVNAILVVGDTIYIGGQFAHIGPPDSSNGWVARANLAAIDGRTGLGTDWNPGTDGPVLALALFNGNIVVGGQFGYAGKGAPRQNLCSVTPDTGIATSWVAQTAGPVNALCVTGTRLLVAGDFSSIGGTARSCAASFNIAGALEAWAPQPDNTVNALAAVGDKVYLGGMFRNVGPLARVGIAQVDSTTGTATAWNSACNRYVTSIVAGDGTLYVGGSYTQIGGAARTNLAEVSQATGQATNWNPAPNSSVNAIALQGSVGFVGGGFTYIGGQVRSRLAALDRTSGAVVGPAYAVDGTIRAITFYKGRLVVGGDFTLIRNRLGENPVRQTVSGGFGLFGGAGDFAAKVAPWRKY